MYSLSYTAGDKCESNPNELMQLNIVFKCSKKNNNEYKIRKVESHNDKCKLNLEIEMASFCVEAAMLEFESKTEKTKDSAANDFCSKTELVGDKILNVYNLTALSLNNGYKISLNESNVNLSLAFNVCRNTKKSDCDLNETKTVGKS